MTTIDKASFKMTIPIIFSIISVTYLITNKLNESNSTIESQVVEIKNNQQISNIQMLGGFKTINNDRKRDSASSKNGQIEIKQEVQDLRSEVKELQKIMFRNNSSTAFK